MPKVTIDDVAELAGEDHADDVGLTLLHVGCLHREDGDAGVGVGGLAIALAAQSTLENFIGGMTLFADKPFVVGDRIAIGQHAGDVIDLRPFQFTLIEIGNWVDADQSTGRLIHVPNGWVFKHTTANFTGGFEFIWNELPVLVTFESDWEKAKEILAGIASKHGEELSTSAEKKLHEAARRSFWNDERTRIVFENGGDPFIERRAAVRELAQDDDVIAIVGPPT